ncbi:hypothetical protein TYRP_015313 [Tyrophagus putrescentiae]|nr:hypothetical protein TYRP_015313 [Tyrophagus putrescentiae]
MGQENSKDGEGDGEGEGEEGQKSAESTEESGGGEEEENTVKAEAPTTKSSPSTSSPKSSKSSSTSNKDNQHIEDSSEFAIKYHHGPNGGAHLINLTPIDVVLAPETAETKSVSGGPNYVDVMAFLVHCPRHQRIALYTDAASGARWLPFIRLPNVVSWIDAAVTGGRLVLGLSKKNFTGQAPFSEVELLQTKRVQLPQKSKFLTRQIFYLKLDTEKLQQQQQKQTPKSTSKKSGGSGGSSSSKCFCSGSSRSSSGSSTNNNFISWVGKKDLALPVIKDKLWGPEVAALLAVIHSFNGEPVSIKSSSSSKDEQMNVLEEFSLEDLYRYAPRDPPRSSEEQLLLEINFNEKHAPGQLPPLPAQLRLPLQRHPPPGPLPRLQLPQIGDISFQELLMGLACLEPLALHHDTRVKFIFRFYDSGSKGFLDVPTDFRRLLVDLESGKKKKKRRKKRKKISAAKLAEVAKSVGVSVQQTASGSRQIITFSNFKSAILEAPKRLNGTHVLCRSKVPVFYQLIQAFISRKRESTAEETGHWATIGKSSVLISRDHRNRRCRRCTTTKFHLAAHVVSFDRKGYPRPKKTISSSSSGSSTATSATTSSSSSSGTALATKSSDASGASSATPAATSNAISPSSSTGLSQLGNSSLDERSVEVLFNAEHIANVMIKMVREFAKRKGNVQNPRGLLDGSPSERKKAAELVVELVTEALKVVNGQGQGQGCQLATVQAPCYVVGDIHGNLEDLLTLERSIWPSAPWSLECALYLISLRLLCPEKVTLLRGNHEVRALQEKYSFKAECTRKYGPVHGETVWTAVNELFDALPISATINEKIFAVHGGLSPNAPTLAAIKALPPVLADPETESKIAWELLWSDPCHMQQYLDVMDANELSSAQFAKDGYVTNFKRGAAYLFNERAAKDFLARNRLSHMIRAHEPPPLGYAHHAKNLVTTVFSCSHYCGNDNAAAVILVEGNRIRPLHVDTLNNSPATEQG